MKALFIDLQQSSSELLTRVFAQAGIACRCANEDDDLYTLLENWPADLIFAHTSSPHRDVLEHLAHSRQDSPQTVIRLFEENSQSIARLAQLLNISLYAPPGLRDSLLQSLVDITISELYSRQQLQTEIAASRFSTERRGKTQRAIQHVAQTYDLAHEQAETLLRQDAKRQQRDLDELAEQLLSKGDQAASGPL